MRTVWKFDLTDAYAKHVAVDGTAVLRLAMPEGAVVRAVELQRLSYDPRGSSTAMLWAEVDTEAPEEERLFALAGTGHCLPEWAAAWVATWQDRPFVWHLYEADRVRLEANARSIIAPLELGT